MTRHQYADDVLKCWSWSNTNMLTFHPTHRISGLKLNKKLQVIHNFSLPKWCLSPKILILFGVYGPRWIRPEHVYKNPASRVTPCPMSLSTILKFLPCSPGKHSYTIISSWPSTTSSQQSPGTSCPRVDQQQQLFSPPLPTSVLVATCSPEFQEESHSSCSCLPIIQQVSPAWPKYLS